MTVPQKTANVTIVTVSYNEIATMPLVCAEIAQAIDRLAEAGLTAEVILVDDNSPDGTAAFAKQEAALRGFTLTVDEGQKGGIGAAFQRGIVRAQSNPDCDLIVTLDADGQHDARAIPELVQAFIDQDADLVIGSRWTAGGEAVGLGWFRTFASKVCNRLLASLTGCNVRDATTSFRAFRPDVVDLDELTCLGLDGYTFFSSFVALAHYGGADIREMPIRFRPRIAGESKLTASEGIRFLRNLARLRSYADMWTSAAGLRKETDIEVADDIPPEFVEGTAAAVNFNHWMVDIADIQPTDNVLEVGAGVGALTPILAERCMSLVSLEPNPYLFKGLAEICEPLERATAMQSLARDLPPEHQFDRIVYVNVLEHIALEADELRVASTKLRPGGKIVVIGPASPRLYSALDRRAGHYRRYTRKALETTLRGAGLAIESAGYFDHLSYVPYLLNYRILGQTEVNDGSVMLFDKVLVPMSRAVASAAAEVPGKNLFAIATPLES